MLDFVPDYKWINLNSMADKNIYNAWWWKDEHETMAAKLLSDL